MVFQNYSLAIPVFDQFGSGTFCWELFLSTLVRWLFSLPGLAFNAALLYVSFFDKKLRSTCSLLLAIGSLCDFVYLLSFSVPLAITLSSLNFVHFSFCYFLQFLPALGLFSSVWIVFFVGLDRLISIICPFWYTRLEKSPKLYVAPMLLVTIGYSLYILGVATPWALFIYPERPVLCTTTDFFVFGDLSTMTLRNGLIINGASFCCYVLVGLALRRFRKRVDSTPTNADSVVDKHRIFKSLAAIMVLVVGTYFGICVFRLLTASITNSFFKLHFSPSFSALLTCTAASSNSPLLCAFSRDYRRAFRKRFRNFPLIGKCLGTATNSKTATKTIGGANMDGPDPADGEPMGTQQHRSPIGHYESSSPLSSLGSKTEKYDPYKFHKQFDFGKDNEYWNGYPKWWPKKWIPKH